MIKKKYISNSIKYIFLISLLFISCDSETKEIQMEELKNEVLLVEHDFAEFAKNEGIAKAFHSYADKDAVLNRNNTLIKGKEEIQKYFESQILSDIKLEWKPDFVDVAKSGDLAYTYGKYTFSAIDSNGDSINSNGIFHTVWKKQTNGIWKYVWD
jgi:ketosteroid isomerase-like protein